MNFMDIFSSISAGGVLSVVIILLSLIEVTPIKISPLSWIGKRINKPVNDKIDKMEKDFVEYSKEFAKLNKKLNEHIAQSYRNKILEFQNECLQKKKHTVEQFAEVFDAIGYYEEFCEKNKVKNEKCKMAIRYIKRVYEKCQDERNFKSATQADYITNDELEEIIESL